MQQIEIHLHERVVDGQLPRIKLGSIGIGLLCTNLVSDAKQLRLLVRQP